MAKETKRVRVFQRSLLFLFHGHAYKHDNVARHVWVSQQSTVNLGQRFNAFTFLSSDNVEGGR